MRTVGVAPGSYTLQLGAPIVACPPDEISSGSYGVPMYGWYDTGGLPPGWPPGMPASLNTTNISEPVLLDAYGTQSQLKGLRGLGLDSTITQTLGIAVGGFLILYALWLSMKRA